MNDELKKFSEYLAEHYAPVFNRVQEHIRTTWAFDKLAQDIDSSYPESDAAAENIFEVTSTKIRNVATGETQTVTFLVFGAIINSKFFWANGVNWYWREPMCDFNWRVNLAPLFDQLSFSDSEFDVRTIPFLVSLVHSPETNVVSFRSQDDIQVFAIVEIEVDNDVTSDLHFDPKPILL
jgi:hypothetical protein